MKKRFKTVIYTAIYGGYDDLKQPPVQDVPCDYICFTDNKRLKHNSGLWRVVIAKRPPAHPRMQAKYFKLMSHLVFPNGKFGFKKYDFTIWIDASIEIKSSAFAREICSYVGTSKWSLLPHPDRDCIYDELDVSVKMPKYDGQPLTEQVAFYKAEGHPSHSGLWACGVIVRSAQLPEKLKALNEAWWEENLHWSYQDQLSLPYLLLKNHIKVDVIQRNLWNNEWFKCLGHNRDS